MLEKKHAFSQEVLAIVSDICKTIFNLNEDQDIFRMFHIKHDQMEGVVKKIIDSLPDEIFKKSNSKLLEEVKYISAREYIFFQVQEKWDDPKYQENLKTFIQIFSRDVGNRIQSYQPFHVTMKEEK